jgi:hypothetical protein
MKHNAPQFEIAGTENKFNLAGEVIRQDETPKTRTDDTPDMFAAIVSTYAHHMVKRATGERFDVIGAKNPNAAKYQAAKQHGGKPSDYYWNWKAE